MKRRNPQTVPQLTETVDDGHQLQMSLWDHLNELRVRLTKAVIGLLIGSIIGFIVSPSVLSFLQTPYGSEFITLGPTDSFLAILRVALLVGGILAVPIITYQVLMFIVPGLTKKEKRFIIMSLPAVTILFVCGVLFTWFILIPPAIDFFADFAPDLFRAEWTADRYLSFVTSLIFWMGVAFQTPLLFFILGIMGFITAGKLVQNWRIAIIGSAIAAAIITPTVDPINMFLVVGPLLTLYLISIFLVFIANRIFQRQVTPEPYSQQS